MKKIPVISLLILLFVVALTSCGPTEAPPAPTEAAQPAPTKAEIVAPTSAPTKSEVVAPTTAPTAAPVAVNKLLRISFAWPVYADPAVGSDQASASTHANVYDTLIMVNPKAGTDPWLAESWDISEEGRTYTFHLRQGVKFHDGSELYASDVVYSLNRLKTIGEGYAYLLNGVQSVEALDDSTVAFTLEKPSGLFVPSLIRLYIVNEDLVRANTLSEGPYGAEGDYGKEWLLTHDAGSGPYTIAEFPLEEYVLLQKFPDWWNASTFKTNSPDQVKFIGTTEAATIRSLMSSGELEISDNWQTVEAFQALDNLEGVDIISFPTSTSFYYMIHNRKPPTDDIHCRKAMAYAFDYQAAVALEWPGTKVMDGAVPAMAGGHDPNVMTYERNLDKAREELAQCEYANELDQYPVELHWISEVPHEEKFALLFQANMAEIGIKVDVVQTPWLSVVENQAKQETSPHIVTIYVSSALPEAGLMFKDRYHSSVTGTWQQNEWLLDPELDAEIDDALATADQDERFQKYASIEAKIMELSPSLFLYDQLEQHAMASYVEWDYNNYNNIMGYVFYLPLMGVNPP